MPNLSWEHIQEGESIDLDVGKPGTAYRALNRLGRFPLELTAEKHQAMLAAMSYVIAEGEPNPYRELVELVTKYKRVRLQWTGD